MEWLYLVKKLESAVDHIYKLWYSLSDHCCHLCPLPWQRAQMTTMIWQRVSKLVNVIYRRFKLLYQVESLHFSSMIVQIMSFSLCPTPGSIYKRVSFASTLITQQIKLYTKDISNVLIIENLPCWWLTKNNVINGGEWIFGWIVIGLNLTYMCFFSFYIFLYSFLYIMPYFFQPCLVTLW